eukprot:gb/GFBE01064990.1/.p1 GENE.gb/GFBE01064990.1/~~gb/GFBE01064990.1/.p1  ORF type:complete len:427 (+),score=72.48 gb/GFBE01064990.1/:1-1281(+)
MRRTVKRLAGVVTKDLKDKLNHQSHISVFQQKVLAVLLGEVLSSTVYEALSVAMAGSDALTNAQALIARSIYAVAISVYSPVMSWLLSNTHGKYAFMATVASNHANICPVLLAWGWKNWAAALDTWAGAELWDEIVVAVVLTLLVVAVQAMPCYSKSKAKILAGEGTLVTRFLVLLSSFGLTLGYVWNTVATYAVGKVQKLESSYHFDFLIQGVYTIIIGTAITVIIVQLKKHGGGPAPTSDVEAQVEKVAAWTGLDAVASNLKSLVCTVLSFIYGWGLLDTSDDFGFGIMFQCSSYSACSYQSNFVYAMIVTGAFAQGSAILNRCKQSEACGPALSQAISLQTNAMVLTVGWAWMNFYSTFMSDATKTVGPGMSVLLYFTCMLVIFMFNSLSNFVLAMAETGHAKALKEAIVELVSGGAATEAEV